MHAGDSLVAAPRTGGPKARRDRGNLDPVGPEEPHTRPVTPATWTGRPLPCRGWDQGQRIHMLHRSLLALIALIAGLTVALSSVASTDAASCARAPPRSRVPGWPGPHATLCLLNRIRRQHGLRPVAAEPGCAAPRWPLDGHGPRPLLRPRRLHRTASSRAATSPAPPSGSSARTSPGAAAPSPPPRRIMNMWMHSPPHRANILAARVPQHRDRHRPRHARRRPGRHVHDRLRRRG